MASDKPRRGELWSCDLRPGLGREMAKRRPILVVSNDVINEVSSTAIVIPISSQVVRLGPERIRIEKGVGNLAKDSIIVVTQIRVIDTQRLMKKIGVVSSTLLAEVEESLRVVLGLTPLDLAS